MASTTTQWEDITLSLPSRQLTYGYHPTTGNLARISDSTGSSLAYTYDGSLPKSTTWSGLVSGSVAWNYDNNFRVTSRTINGGNSIGFGYDNDNLLTSAGSLTLTRNSQNGLLTGTTLGNVTDSWSYDSFAEPTSYSASFSGSPVFTQTFTHDKLGRITTKTETIQGITDTYVYGYDAAGRLETVTKNSVLASQYTYDANGNRLTRATAAGTATYTTDNQDRLTTWNLAPDTWNLTYTANGELQSKANGSQTTAYSYDVAGNIRHVTLPDGAQIDYIIDAQNRRVGKKVNGVLDQGWLYGNQLNPVAELDGSGNIVSIFVYGSRSNVPDYMVKAGITYRLISDHLGSPRLAINTADGSVAQRLDYDEFGNVTQDTNPGFQPFAFAGGLYDVQAKLTRFGARDYDPEAGRWTAKDPVFFNAGDFNLYGYVLGDPLNFLDGTGLARKPGRTPNKLWPPLPPNLGGNKPRWNPGGYWEGKGDSRLTWDDRSHGTGVDRGQGPQDGHWDDETSDERWDRNGNRLPLQICPLTVPLTLPMPQAPPVPPLTPQQQQQLIINSAIATTIAIITYVLIVLAF